MGWESTFDVVRFDLGPLLQGQTRTAKLKSAFLLLVLQVCNVKPTYRKSWAGNLLIWSYLTLSPSFKVKGVQPNLKVLITDLLLILEVCNVKPICRISWAGNLLMLSDWTLGPSFKVKRWLTGFGELSFRWIQMCIGSPMCRPSSKYYVHPPGGWIYYFCFFRRPMSDVRCPLSDVRCPMSGVRRPMSGVTHGFRSFKGKVLELLSPNLVCRLIGSVACLGLLLAVVPLLLTE